MRAICQKDFYNARELDQMGGGGGGRRGNEACDGLASHVANVAIPFVS